MDRYYIFNSGIVFDKLTGDLYGKGKTISLTKNTDSQNYYTINIDKNIMDFIINKVLIIILVIVIIYLIIIVIKNKKNKYKESDL